MNMKIGILAIGMIVLFIASTIPAVTADGEPQILIEDGTADVCAKIKLINFVAGDEFTIIIEGKYESVIDVTGSTIVTIGTGEGNDIQLDPGTYHVKVKCGHVMEQGHIVVIK